MGPRYNGGVFLADHLYTWGDELRQWDGHAASSRVVATGPFRFGCAFGGSLVLERTDELRWLDSTIDTGTKVIDACEANLFQRNGLLVVHRGMQVRFYERPSRPVERWPYREIYSFYTASEQGGLLLQDVDGDGRPDIICGNYWIQAPAEFDLPWRLYAINLFNEHPLSASARLAWVGGRLLWLESKRANARLRWFTPLADPRQLWREEPIDLKLDYPRAVLVRGDRIWIGHRDGIVELPEGRPVLKGTPVHTLIETPAGVVAIGRARVVKL